jgi:hypothetical protein
MANQEAVVEDAVQEDVAMEEGSTPESISLNDLQLLLQIVDLASKRGAFAGAEMTQVGGIFDKLNAFLTYVAEQQAAQAEADEEAGEETPAEE